MVKQPIAGQVKTRLAAEVGTSAAINFYRATTTAVIARLSNSPKWQTVLAVTPATACQQPMWPTNVPQIPQYGEDLGCRMQNAIAAMPPGPVVLIGSDIPAIRPAHIAAAFQALVTNDTVFGPASDGGYWLVGTAGRKPITGAFSNVRWSGPHALGDTISNLTDHRIALIDTLGDVDDGQDLEKAAPWFGRRVLPSQI